MLNITKNLEEHLYFTATENATIANPFFLFVFTHKTTLEEIVCNAFNSSLTGRYDYLTDVKLQSGNEFPINEAFDNATLGFWGYTIYQKANLADFTKTGVILESGFMVLHPESVTLPTEYTDQNNEFKVYNGE